MKLHERLETFVHVQWMLLSGLGLMLSISFYLVFDYYFGSYPDVTGACPRPIEVDSLGFVLACAR